MTRRRQVPWAGWAVALTIACCGALAPAKEQGAARIFRPARYTRGNTGVFPLQPIDAAAWLTHPDDAMPGGRCLDSAPSATVRNFIFLSLSDVVSQRGCFSSVWTLCPSPRARRI